MSRDRSGDARDLPWFPGRAGLRRRVLHACGPGRQFEALGYPFLAWISEGPDALPRTVERVEPYLAAYLAKAHRVGKVRGAVAGIIVGVAGLAAALIAVTVLR